MNKKLTTKTQELNPNLSQYSSDFSKSFVIKPETQELELRKGSLYAVCNISSNTNFDTELTTRVINDVLHETYYQSESISPIQSLEKAIRETRNKVTQLSSDSISTEAENINFNIVAGVLWGNVIYVVLYSNASAYLMRGGEIREVSTTSEGNFSAASGMVEDDDVLIFCSKQFEKTYPPQKLLSTRISEGELAENQSCILIKLIVDTSFSKDEMVDFGLEREYAKTRAKEKKESISLKFVSILPKIKLVNKISETLKNKSEYIRNISKTKGNSQDSVKKEKIVALSESSTFLNKIISNICKYPKRIMPCRYLFIVIVALGLGISVFISIKNKKTDTNQLSQTNKYSTDNKQNIIGEEKPQENQQLTLSSEELKQREENDKKFNIQRVDPKALYDIKIVKESFSPKSIEVTENKIVVSDVTGTIYSSDIGTIKFEEKATFPSANYLINIEGKVGLLSQGNFKIINTDNYQEDESYTIDATVTSTYSEYIYGIKNDVLTRYSKENKSLINSPWGQNEEFRDARSMAIAYSIYIVTKDGTVSKYTSGNKASFEIKNLDTPLNNPVEIIANIDFDNIYIADTGNKRIIILDEQGNIIKQIKSNNESDLDNIVNIAVSTDEKTIYILNSSRVLEISM